MPCKKALSSNGKDIPCQYRCPLLMRNTLNSWQALGSIKKLVSKAIWLCIKWSSLCKRATRRQGGNVPSCKLSAVNFICCSGIWTKLNNSSSKQKNMCKGVSDENDTS